MNKRYKVVLVNGIIFIFCLSFKVYSQHPENLKGDLFFVLIDYARFMDTPDSLALVEEREMIRYDSIEPGNTISILYRELKRMRLLREPHIDIIDENNIVSRIIVSRDDYNKLEKFNGWELIDRNQKVVLELTVKKIELPKSIEAYRFYKAVDHIKYSVVNGITRHN